MSQTNESPNEAAFLTTWAVPGVTQGAVKVVDARAGEATVVVGANGSGKSALGILLDSNSAGALSHRLIAHRRIWFQAAGPEISPAQRASVTSTMDYWASQQDSRYVDHAENQRTDIVLFDVLALLNGQNGKIADLLMSGAERKEINRVVGAGVLDRLNGIIESSGLPIQLTLTDVQTFDAINSTRGVQYPIHQMSDGEKSAVLLASEVLVAPANSIQIIDEPERHLHRSISAGLVEAIMEDRKDCHFVVLTHDLELASALAGRSRSQAYVLSDCVWSGEVVTGWDLLALGDPSEVPEFARRAILGGRRDVLFVEGKSDSLDVKLYRLLFPGWTVVPAGGAEQVQRAVTGLTASHSHHWVRARGVVDGDGRGEEEQAAMRVKGVLPLPVSEVESLYYLEVARKAVAVRQAETLEQPSELLIKAAADRALAALKEEGILEHLASKLAVGEVRRKVMEHVPSKLDADIDPIKIEVVSPFSSVLTKIVEMSEAEDLEGLIRSVPIRDTPMCGRVASTLGFRSASDYEAAVRSRVKADAALARELSALVGPLPEPQA